MNDVPRKPPTDVEWRNKVMEEGFWFLSPLAQRIAMRSVDVPAVNAKFNRDGLED